jgi:hypothetical protein
MTRKVALSFLCLIVSMRAFAQAQGQTQTQDQGADPTQSFVSPLGLGTGATVAVTSKGTSVAAAFESQMKSSIVNFWQAAFSGTIDKNGQQLVYSSHDSDAPGFKGKFGIGKSSFIRPRPIYTATGGDFLRQVWCRDLLNEVNKTLATQPGATIPKDADCSAAVKLESAALAASPPANPQAATFDDQVVKALAGVALTLTSDEQIMVCALLKDQAKFYQFCPAQGFKSVELLRRNYPDLYSRIVFGQPSKFQWKAWGNWAPSLTSINYRAVNAGVPDLATKLQWTQLLNTGLGDLAVYYGPLAFGVEGGYGQTVQVKTQNVCNNTISGTFTAQQCDTAMVGKPNPKNSWMSSATFDLNPLPGFGKEAVVNPGVQIVFSYVVPTSGGHSSEIAAPFYLAPTKAPIKFVFGIQPTWDWNTDPKIGNKFSISLFFGARPEITH